MIQTAIKKLVCQLFVPAKDAHFQSERYELVPVQEEASPIRKTISNTSCIEGGHTIVSRLPDNGVEQ